MKPKRRSIRLPGYDYASAGWYFVTICCHKRQHLFGEIVRANCIRPDGPVMELNQLGRIVHEEWLKTAEIRPEVELGEFVVMPNHFHAILGLTGHSGLMQEAGVCNTPLQSQFIKAADQADTDLSFQSPSQTIGAIVRGFKSSVTKQIRQTGIANDIWQRNYYEHIIRNEDS